MTKRRIISFPALVLNSLLFISLTAACNSPEKGEDQAPNVLLILVDDLKPALGCYGDRHARTPNIDRLAARGMRFEMAYCNQAVCAPSRNNLMLGSLSTSLGLYTLGRNFRSVSPDAITLTQYFMENQYRAEGIGKVFHIGHGNHDDTASWSTPFQPDLVVEYLKEESRNGGKFTKEEAYFGNMGREAHMSAPRGAAWEWADVPDSAYADGRIAKEGIRRLQAAKKRSQPFFLALGFVKPHLPFTAPKKYWDMHDPESLPMPEILTHPEGAPGYARKGWGEIAAYTPIERGPEPIGPELTRKLIHGYYAASSFVDAQIGRVLDELDRLELAENTLIVLWGDHGWHLGDHSYWTKHTNYEQANRIPLIFIAPGVIKPGSSTRQPAQTVDVFPTLVELAGLPQPDLPQPLDGLSLVPVLKDPSIRIRDHVVHAYPRKDRIGRAVRTERYRLVEWNIPGHPPDSADIELYDYQQDPLESKNLAVDSPELVKELLLTLNQYPLKE